MRNRVLQFATAFASLACASAFAALVQMPRQDDPEQAFKPDWVSQFDWRLIGPANMGGRIVAMSVYEEDPTTFWVGTAGGGLLKTTNNGVTFEHQFEHEGSIVIGDVEVAQSDPSIVWVGTGEQNPRNSVSWGDGVYKSTDGGETWEHKGLKESFQIGRLWIHPEDPDTVFVGSMGRCWGPGGERGLYRTTDGGDNWEQVLFVDERTGVIDIASDPEDPDTMLVATWERQRDEFDTNDPAKRWGPGSGLYRTTDGGDTWDEITDGLPSVEMGRLSIWWSRANPGDVYMLVDSRLIGTGIANPGYLGMTGQAADAGARITRVTEDGPAEEAGLKVDDVVVAVDGERIINYDELLSAIRIREAGTEVTLEAVRGDEIVEITATLAEPPEPVARPFTQDLGGQADSIQDEQGDDGHETGGLFKSEDAGETWTRINSINPRPMYFSKIYTDPSDDNYQWILGVPLSKSEDGGETWTRDGTPGIVHVDHHVMWIDPRDGRHMLLGNDGGLYVTYDRGKTWDHLDHAAIAQAYHVSVDTNPLYNVYLGLQDNGTWGAPNRTRTSEGTYNTDWFRVGGGDGFVVYPDPNDPDQLYYSSQNGGVGRVHLETGERRGLRPRAPRGETYRFNWKTPHMVSNHNSQIFYMAGNKVFRSYHKGDDLKAISPEISRTRRGSATAFAESPVDSDVLYVGTDDGALWVTRDGGAEWHNIVFPYDESAYPEESDRENDALAFDMPVDEAGNPLPPEEEEAGDEPPARGPGARRGGGGPAGAGAGGPGAGGGAERAARMLERLDENDDGKIQRSEAPERMGEFFDMLDANDDGVLTADELASGPGAGPGAGAPGADRPRSDAPADRAGQRRGAGAPGGGVRRGPPAQDDEDQPDGDKPDHPLAGTWTGGLVGQGEGNPFTLTFSPLDNGNVRVEVNATVLDDTTDAGTFDAESGAARWVVRGEQGEVVFEAVVEGDKMSGTLDVGGGMFSADFEATRDAAKGDEPAGPTLASLIPGPRRVQSIEASRFERDRVYITLDGHYADDDAPHVYASEDAGRSWRSLNANLPDGSTRVIREDLENPNVLYLGTEFGAWVSVDRGLSWTRFNNNLPHVAIHEFAQHTTSGELIAGTHGRSLWAIDVTPIRQMTDRARDAEVWLFEPNEVIRWRSEGARGRGASRWFAGENPADVAMLYYRLEREAGQGVELEIRETSGALVRRLEAPAGAGLHRVSWDLRREPPQGGNARFRRGALVPTGVYRVILRVDDEEVARDLRVVADPDSEGGAFSTEEFLAELYAEEEDEHAAESDEEESRDR